MTIESEMSRVDLVLSCAAERTNTRMASDRTVRDMGMNLRRHHKVGMQQTDDAEQRCRRNILAAAKKSTWKLKKVPRNAAINHGDRKARTEISSLRSQRALRLIVSRLQRDAR